MNMKRRSAREKKHYLNWLLALFVIAIILALLVPGASAEWYRRARKHPSGANQLLAMAEQGMVPIS